VALTLVQLTDLHLLSDRDARMLGVPTWQTFAELLAMADEVTPEPDRLLLTGDLAQDELPSTYAQLREVLAERCSTVRALPGNHDSPAAIRLTFPEGFSDDLPGAMFAEEAAGWLIVGLDSHVDGEVGGTLGGAQVDRLDGVLRAHPDRPTVLFLHHPPAPVGAAWLDQMGLSDADALGDALAPHADRIAGIFCGHVHQDVRSELAGIPVWTTPSTAFQFAVDTTDPDFDEVPPGFRVIDLHDDGTLSTRVVRAPELRFSPVHPGPGGY